MNSSYTLQAILIDILAKHYYLATTSIPELGTKSMDAELKSWAASMKVVGTLGLADSEVYGRQKSGV